MAQLFHRSTNALSRLTIFGALIAIGAVTWAWAGVIRAPYITDQNVVREGAQVEIGGNDRYVSVCHKHFVSGDI